MSTENTSLDFSGMDDAALEASLNDEPYTAPDADTEATDESATTAAGQTPATDTEEGQQEGQEGTEGEQPKLVDLRALQEERELRKQERDRAAALEAELARFKQQEAQALAAQHDAQIQANYEQILTEQGEEAAAAYINNLTRQREAQMQQQYHQQTAVNTLLLSEEMVREVYGQEYDTRFNHVRGILGDAAMSTLIDRSLQEAPRAPAKWLLEQFKAHFPTEADRNAVIEAEVQKRFAELQGKGKPPAIRGHQSIGHISSGTQNPGAKKPLSKMSDAELARELDS